MAETRPPRPITRTPFVRRAGGPEHYLEALDFVQTELRPRSYCEIGVSRGRSLSLALPATAAVGVDPRPRLRVRLSRSTKVFEMTSDEFFARNNVTQITGTKALDLGFIDGLHLFEYALRDFINLERHCSPDSVVLVHDCHPPEAAAAGRENRPGQWAGDVWKLIVCLRENRPDLRVSVFNVPPTGLGVITNLDSGSSILAERYEEICERFVPLDYGHIEGNQERELALTDGTWMTLRELLPTHPYRRRGRLALWAGRELRLRLPAASRHRSPLRRRVRKVRRRARRGARRWRRRQAARR